MNKKLIAMAVAASVALPMSAVKADPVLYGQLQVEVASVDTGGTSSANADKGTPGASYVGTDDNKRGRLGVKGDEDLGNGMKAIYNFEWQVETTQGDVGDGNRVGMVGLKGGFGQVEAGALKPPYKYTGGVKYDPFVTTYLEARSRGGMSGKTADGKYISGAAGHHGFMTDGVAYKNKFGPIQLWVATSFDEKGGAKGNDGDINAAVKYSGGNFEAFYALATYDGVKQSDSNYIVGTGVETKSKYTKYEYTASKIGGMFKTGAHKIKLQLESTELKEPSSRTYCSEDSGGTGCSASGPTTDSSKFEGSFLFLGYELKMGKNVIAVSYGTAEFKDTDTDNGSDVDYLTVGAIHKFSKKTRAFVGYSSSESTSKAAGSSAVKATALSLGLRVDF